MYKIDNDILIILWLHNLSEIWNLLINCFLVLFQPSIYIFYMQKGLQHA